MRSREITNGEVNMTPKGGQPLITVEKSGIRHGNVETQESLMTLQEWYNYYNCGRKRHYAKDCRSPTKTEKGGLSPRKSQRRLAGAFMVGELDYI